MKVKVKLRIKAKNVWWLWPSGKNGSLSATHRFSSSCPTDKGGAGHHFLELHFWLPKISQLFMAFQHSAQLKVNLVDKGLLWLLLLHICKVTKSLLSFRPLMFPTITLKFYYRLCMQNFWFDKRKQPNLFKCCQKEKDCCRKCWDFWRMLEASYHHQCCNKKLALKLKWL